MVSALGLWVSKWFGRLMPDPFVIAVLLSLLTAVLGLAVGDFPGLASRGITGKALALLDSWGTEEGLWKFLAFSMQMCVILVGGHALASAPAVRRLLTALAGLPRGTASGAGLICFAGCVCSLINWGLGLIAGAILAREVGRSLHARGIKSHYPLLVAAGFAGFMVWHGGLSGSAPLSMTSLASAAKALPAETIAALRAAGYEGGVPLSATVFSPVNLVISLGLAVIIPLCAAAMAPRDEADIREMADVAPAVIPAAEEARGTSPRTLAERLDSSPLASGLLAAALAAVVIRFGGSKGLLFAGLNEVNMMMVALGLVLHGSTRSYLAAVDDAAKGCGGIILQFPLYGGIASMLVASGLAKQMAGALVDVGTATTLPAYVFWIACLLNLFIPSGGGQWAVQGPISLEAGLRLGLHPGEMVMAVAYGDELTNMLQPFWALPLLAITGVKARDIVGYTTLLMLVGGVWITAWLLIL
ncbi:MAG: short-chain fatty acid transporter [Planctomycetes bacterium]|nr:short-chain fatty acid transporter [Planctomycetota bacterium]